MRSGGQPGLFCVYQTAFWQLGNSFTLDDLNTVSLLGRAYSLLGFQIVDGVVGAGYPQKPSHSAVGSNTAFAAAAARERPARDAKLVGQIPFGTRKIQGFGCTNDTPAGDLWCRVKYRDVVGWVSEEFIRQD